MRRVLQSQLSLQQSNFAIQAIQDSPSRLTTLRIDNPSLEAMTVTATLPSSLSWLGLGSVGSTSTSDVVKYGDPAFLPLLISPSSVLRVSIQQKFRLWGLV